MQKRLEVPIGSKQILLLHVDMRRLYKMVIGTAKVNSSLHLHHELDIEDLLRPNWTILLLLL